MTETRSPKWAFLILLIALMIGFVAVIRPFMMALLFALLIAVICGPVYSLFLRLFRGWRYLASSAATFFVLVCVMIPLAVAVGIVIIYSSDAINFAVQSIESGRISLTVDQINTFITQRAGEYAGFIPSDLDIKAAVLSFLKSAGKVVYNYSPKVVSATAGVVSGFFLTLIFVFVFFADGERLYHAVFDLLPLEKEHKQVIAREIKGVISAAFLGQMLTSLAQGLLIGIGFWIAGIQQPVIWGAVAVAVTLIPVIGGPLMYIPAVAIMAINGYYGKAVFLLIYGVGVVSMVDNLIKPLILRGKVDVHPILLAMGLIGGGIWLGASGIIIGPLIIVLLLAMLRIYKKESAGL